ncbi:malto-oligosyltrehalose synthase [Ancylobacter sp. G4_0304]|uniref:malto-oligosyltrehalose synthase n=1 Tax=Ancylobacter sp. G4_0304 TaxID=3114289 RepID=UPI0039C69262
MNATLSSPSLVATYRLQFHRGFTFADAEALVPYLAGLGVSHLYASPITLAVPGSTHGYDVADPTRINPELGGEEGFERLARALAGAGMGVVLDIVPNHMAASCHNPFWMAMLEHGPASPAARVFDVSPDAGKLLVPVLGEPLRATLEAGGLSLRTDSESGRILVVYADHIFPLRRESVAGLLDAAGLSGDLRSLDAAGRAALDRTLAAADLGAILEDQHWRLAWWRTAAHDLNYRRFFNITDLIGVRVEDPEVFELVHRLPLDLLRRGLVHGLRVDHIDGLVDPAGYCDRLRTAAGPEALIVVEKILEPGETLRDWPIDGTTGYERLNDINGLFVDEAGYQSLEQDLRERHLLTGTLESRLAAAKRQVLEGSLAAEVDVLAALARDGLDDEIRAGDLTETAIRQAVIALLVHCPVYRSYATWEAHDALDEAVWDSIADAIAAAEDPLTQAAAAVLLDRLRRPLLDSDRAFRLRFQQLGGPAMAKGFEDTELYRYPVLLAVNEVGGSLAHPARTVEEMHALNAARAAAGARDLTPLATHDTKRGADTRARLAALSFQPQLWLDFLRNSAEPCATLAGATAGAPRPDALDQVLILQTLLSVWPVSEERICTYLTKALREAKRHTSWETPDEAYEAASVNFARALVTSPDADTVREEIETLLSALLPAAAMVGLAQTVLQLTLPGTPDLYQGTEFQDLSLVDPDNRRPVVWAARRAALSGGGDIAAEDREKFDVTYRLLQLRRRNPALIEGDYTPLHLPATSARWFGFERRSGGAVVRVAVPTRLAPSVDATPPLHEIMGSWEWTDLDGQRVSAGSAEMTSARPYVVVSRLDE